jgi:ankyrin repeat protein
MPGRTHRRGWTSSKKTGRAVAAESDSDSDGSDCSGSSTEQSELFGAIEDGDAKEFERLLREDPECVKEVNKNGWTAAHQAAYSGEHVMLKRVLELGVDVNARCSDGDLAVHYACAQGEKKCLNVLAKAGSDMEAKDNDGETPLDVATMGIRERLAELIVEARNSTK